MATVDNVFQLLKYRASKNGYTGTITSTDFNLVFPKAELKYYLKLFGNQNKYQYGNPVPPIAYPGTLKVSTSLSKFGTIPQIINIDASGRWAKPVPNDIFFIDSLSHFVRGTGGTSLLTYTITPGSGYTNGNYVNIAFTGGAGSGVRANVTVAGGVITAVQLTSIGSGFAVGNSLITSSIPAGSGFSITVVTLTQNIPTPVKRVEKQDLADNLYSYYEQPTEIFPIYVEYSDYIQFFPTNLATAQLIYLRKPATTAWGFTLNGGVATINTLTPGSGYTNGTYPNVIFTGGAGNSAAGTVVVSGGLVTSVTITTPGFGYAVSKTQTGTIPPGTGWSFKVATISNAREVYNAGTSVDPEWDEFDLDEMIYLALADIGIFLKDSELENFAVGQSSKGGIS